MQSRKTLTANGLTFSYLEEGSGPLVLCLHGFPDTAETWRQLMPALAAAGYRAVAPNMRGYPPSSFAPGNDYSAARLGEDVGALIDALDAQSAVVIGHDWGALAAYRAANQFADKISRLITVAIPHPRTIRFSARTVLKARHFITFQFRRYAVWRMKRANFSYVDAIYRRWSPNWAFGADDLQPVKEAFAVPGAVEAALGYYWSFQANRSNTAEQQLTRGKTAVPTLCLVGDADGALDLTAMAYTPRAFTGPYAYQILPDVGHFLHREIPEQFAQIVLEELGRAG